MTQRRQTGRIPRGRRTAAAPEVPALPPDPPSPRSADEIVDEASRESMAGSDSPAFTPVSATRTDPGAIAAAVAEHESDPHRRIQRRAYEIWDGAGRPAGRDMEHWLQAEREVLIPLRGDPAPRAPA